MAAGGTKQEKPGTPPGSSRRPSINSELAAAKAEARMLEVARLRVEGASPMAIAKQLKVTRRVVLGDMERWLEEAAPSEEQAESLRQLMMERLETLHGVWWRWATKPSRTHEFGSPQPPSDKAAEILLKIQDRQAALMGVNLQPNAVQITVTAESIAEFLGWDNVVDVVATEQPALSAGNEEREPGHDEGQRADHT